jgi:hypothetical protein
MNELNNDVIKCILLSNKHAITLIQTCKNLLMIASSKDILCDLIKFHLDKLPHIFFASLPSYLVNIPYSPIDSNLKLKNCCLTGGHIVKKVYNIKYKSDIDIWTTKDTKINLSKRHKVDIIRKDKEPYRCISTSDLSICQQGIVYDNNKNKQLHVTLLSLYTYYTKVILIKLIPLKRQYDSDWSSNGEHIKGIESYYVKHIGIFGGHGELFHKCKQCMHKWNEKDEVFNYIRIWFQRIEKYQKRFPDYKIKYIQCCY